MISGISLQNAGSTRCVAGDIIFYKRRETSMEIAMNLGVFEALDQDEMFVVDGGAPSILGAASVFAGVYSLAVTICGSKALASVAVCAAIAANPVVQVTSICAGADRVSVC